MSQSKNRTRVAAEFLAAAAGISSKMEILKLVTKITKLRKIGWQN